MKAKIIIIILLLSILITVLCSCIEPISTKTGDDAYSLYIPDNGVSLDQEEIEIKYINDNEWQYKIKYSISSDIDRMVSAYFPYHGDYVSSISLNLNGNKIEHELTKMLLIGDIYNSIDSHLATHYDKNTIVYLYTLKQEILDIYSEGFVYATIGDEYRLYVDGSSAISDNNNQKRFFWTNNNVLSIYSIGSEAVLSFMGINDAFDVEEINIYDYFMQRERERIINQFNLPLPSSPEEENEYEEFIDQQINYAYIDGVIMLLLSGNQYAVSDATIVYFYSQMTSLNEFELNLSGEEINEIEIIYKVRCSYSGSKSRGKYYSSLKLSPLSLSRESATVKLINIPNKYSVFFDNSEIAAMDGEYSFSSNSTSEITVELRYDYNAGSGSGLEGLVGFLKIIEVLGRIIVVIFIIIVIIFLLPIILPILIMIVVKTVEYFKGTNKNIRNYKDHPWKPNEKEEKEK